MRFVTPIEVHTGAQRTVYAADQPPYYPLPCAVDAEGLVLAEVELSREDLDVLQNGGRVRLWVQTFGRPLQPMSLEAIPLPVEDPALISLAQAEDVLSRETVIVENRLLNPLDDGQEIGQTPGTIVHRDGVFYKDEGAVQ